MPITIIGELPLILITTNEERVLPNAFIRRCLVLHMTLPEEEAALIAHLESRGRAHFRGKTSDAVLHEAAQQLVADRKVADEAQLNPLPGQAEYLDLVRAVINLAGSDMERQKQLLKKTARFTL